MGPVLTLQGDGTVIVSQHTYTLELPTSEAFEVRFTRFGDDAWEPTVIRSGYKLGRGLLVYETPTPELAVLVATKILPDLEEYQGLDEWEQHASEAWSFPDPQPEAGT